MAIDTFFLVNFLNFLLIKIKGEIIINIGKPMISMVSIREVTS